MIFEPHGLPRQVRLIFCVKRNEAGTHAAEEAILGMLETNIQLKISRLGIPKAVVARLNSISETRFSAGMNGTNPFAGHVLLSIDRSLISLEDIAEIIAPLKLPLTDVATLKTFIDQYNEGGLATLRGHEALVNLRDALSQIR